MTRGWRTISKRSRACYPTILATPCLSRPRSTRLAASTKAEPRWTRIRAVAAEFDFLKFDTSSLIAEANRVAVEITIYYRHRETGVFLQTTFVDFWTFEDGRPVKLVEYHDVARMQDFMTNVARAMAKV